MNVREWTSDQIDSAVYALKDVIRKYETFSDFVKDVQTRDDICGLASLVYHNQSTEAASFLGELMLGLFRPRIRIFCEFVESELKNIPHTYDPSTDDLILFEDESDEEKLRDVFVVLNYNFMMYVISSIPLYKASAPEEPESLKGAINTEINDRLNKFIEDSMKIHVQPFEE